MTELSILDVIGNLRTANAEKLFKKALFTIKSFFLSTLCLLVTSTIVMIIKGSCSDIEIVLNFFGGQEDQHAS